MDLRKVPASMARLRVRVAIRANIRARLPDKVDRRVLTKVLRQDRTTVRGRAASNTSSISAAAEQYRGGRFVFRGRSAEDHF